MTEPDLAYDFGSYKGADDFAADMEDALEGGDR